MYVYHMYMYVCLNKTQCILDSIWLQWNGEIIASWLQLCCVCLSFCPPVCMHVSKLDCSGVNLSEI